MEESKEKERRNRGMAGGKGEEGMEGEGKYRKSIRKRSGEREARTNGRERKECEEKEIVGKEIVRKSLSE